MSDESWKFIGYTANEFDEVPHAIVGCKIPLGTVC